MDNKSSVHPLYPRPLSIAKVIAPIKFKRKIISAIEELGNIEPIQVDPRTGADQLHVEDRRNTIETLRNKLSGYISAVDIDLIAHDAPISVGFEEEDVLKFLNNFIDTDGNKIEGIINRQDEINSRITELKSIIKLLEQFDTLDVNSINRSAVIADTSHTKTFLGTIFPPQLKRLLWIIDEITQGRYIIVDKEISEKDTIVIISVLREDAEAIQIKLNSLNFQNISVPKDLDLDGLSTFDCNNEIEALKREKEGINEKFTIFTTESGLKLAAAFELCNVELQRISIELTMRRTETTCILWAWLPDKVKEDFRTAMHRVTEGSSSVDFRKGDFDPEFTPTYVTNSKFMEPMRGLVTSFGTPSTNEIDPYPFVKFLFPILFGIMFADVGHGFVLFLIGLYAKRKKNKMKEIPKGISGFFYGGAELLIILGLTGMIFGIPMNSVFGDETLLWQVPLFRYLFEDTTWKFFFTVETEQGETYIERNYVNFLIFSFALGAFVILLGLILNIYQLIIYRKSNSDLYAALTLTATYVSVIFAALSAALFSDITFLIPVFMIFSLLSMVTTLYIEKKAHGIDGLMLGIDHIISLLSNTFSFGRLLAMNTIHYVLAFLPYLFLNMKYDGVLNHSTEKWIGPEFYIIWVIAAIIGALIVVPVETTFSTLQSLRLNWVEFFGKFYKGNGIRFKPVQSKRIYTLEIPSLGQR